MDFIADVLMAAGALGVAVYCFVLSQRLRNLSSLDKGVGGAVSELSGKVETMTELLSKAEKSAQQMDGQLAAQIERGEKIAKRLELLLASMHDLPVENTKPAPKAQETFETARSAPAPAPKKGQSQFLRHRRNGERIN